LKRAIVWLCWGERFVREAIASARSAASIAADRILITDAAGAACAAADGAFTSVVPTQVVHGNNLEKSRLIDLVPPGYDAFLYLDTDTRIVGDVSLGFDKAERHGIAMAPAPNYNLSEYFGFGEIMTRLGVRPADQMMYNAGVFFFRLTPVIRRVLECWRDLCAGAGAQLNFPHDQPFLTLALEQLGVTPYVLSPLYNYRSLGEYAVGNIRLWHSHLEPPADLNVFDNAWPARRFKDGVLMPVNASPAAPLPQGMLQLRLSPFMQRHTPAEVQDVAAEALVIQGGLGSRLANDFLIDQIGIEGSVDNNEPYFAEAVHYHLGLLQAYAGDPIKMAAQLRLSRTMPSGEDDQIYSDHVNVSHALRARQDDAVARGLPPILIACMPRSASATLTHTLARALAIPVMHVSVGRFPDYFIAPSWLDMFLEGGAITQDHFAASDFNLGVLHERGPRDVFVLARDPRAAARSQIHFLARNRRNGSEPIGLRIERECIAHFIPWLQGWIDCAKRDDAPLRIHWLTYDEVCRSPVALLRRISRVLAHEHPAIASFAEHRELEQVNVHFVTGDDHAWEAEVDYATRERLWAACTPEIKSLLDLAW
jgi:hypothetical protein